MAKLEANQESTEAVLAAHLLECAELRKETNIRMRGLERVMWMASGLIIAVQGIFVAIMIAVLKNTLKLT